MIDLDGVVWLAGRAIDGSAEALGRLRAAGTRLAFVTNNSTPTVEEYLERLAAAGVEVERSELATSSQAAASLVDPGTRVAVLGGPGVVQALSERRAQLVDLASHPDVVLVGRSLELDFAELAAAASAVRAGARFVATNTDATFPTPAGLEPGTGALVAYLEVSSGRKPEVAGKPEAAMAQLVRSRYGQPDRVVGDRAETDGEFAKRVGSPFALVLSGVTSRDDLPVDPEPAVVADDLSSLVAQHFGTGGAGS